MECPKCDKKIEPGDKFCPHCGENLEQKNVVGQSRSCTQCGKSIELNATFCEHCGAKISPNQSSAKNEKPEPHKIVSKGAYSGKMNTGRSKFRKRLIWSVIIIVLIAALSILIWFQVDDNAEEKLKEALRIPVAVVLIGFALYVMIFGKSKKGRFRGGDDGDYDDDWDDGDDD